MTETTQANEAADGQSQLTEVLATLRKENERLRADFERECADVDKVFAAIGWGVERTRTEGGSLKVAALCNAIRAIIAPGDGG
jgi:hypothetical protein